jgi:hypothetical protein
MPSRDEIAIDINHGETLIVLNKCNVTFKRKNIIIEKALTTEQWCNVMDTISQKVKQKCDYIEESIKLGLNEVIR